MMVFQFFLRLCAWFIQIGLVILAITIVLFNLRLFYSPSFSNENDQTVNQDVYEHLNHLQHEMHNGAATEMQLYFPEGFVFMTSLYGLSWCDLISELDTNNVIYKDGLREVNWALNQLQAEEATCIFNENLPLPYGAFYVGWSNLLLAKKVSISKGNSSEDLNLLDSNALAIKMVLAESKMPFIDSYWSQCWPADVSVMMASLACSEPFIRTRVDSTIKKWVVDIQQYEDAHGLLPHSIDAETGNTLEPSKGASSSLFLVMLFEVDKGLGRRYFEKYKALFLDRRMGLIGVREFRKGIDGSMDIDSGPIVWDIGGAASIVGQRTMALYGDTANAISLRNSIEAFGLGLTYKGKKNYLLGQVPIADAFIAWSNALELNSKTRWTSGNLWRLRLQGWSSLVLMFIIGLYVTSRRLRSSVKGSD